MIGSLGLKGEVADTKKVAHRCRSCGKGSCELKRCLGCRKVWYCDRACQAAHWAAHHKARCKAWARVDTAPVHWEFGDPYRTDAEEFILHECGAVDAHIWLEDARGGVYDCFFDLQQLGASHGIAVRALPGEVCAGERPDALEARGLVYRAAALPLAQALFAHWAARLPLFLRDRLAASLLRHQSETATLPPNTAVAFA